MMLRALIFRCLQVWHAVDLPGTPTILGMATRGQPALGLDGQTFVFTSVSQNAAYPRAGRFACDAVHSTRRADGVAKSSKDEGFCRLL